ncbi:MAG: multicopper oxidase domain-containing protein [Rhodomicrobium sp.]
MDINRRTLLKAAGTASLLGALPRALRAAGPQTAEKADYTLRIATGLVELGPEHIVSTTLYNGQFPGPLLRLKEGRRVTIDIYNDTDEPELVHPHGLIIPIDADGAAEEGSPRAWHAPHLFCAEAFRISVLSHACGAGKQSKPGHLYRPGRPYLYQAQGQSRRL